MKKLILEKPYPKQEEFYLSRKRYTAYGGARGGGKSLAARNKAIMLALNYSGIQIILLRKTLAELRENHIIPMLIKLKNIAKFKEQTKEFIFPNGSRIVLGYCANEKDVLQYQGQAYDVIFMEEATHFTEFQFMTLTESNRPSGICKEAFSPRMYFTCNPGGVGHTWVKRLFIDRDYRRKENPDDYKFIKALVYDNDFIMKNDPDYVRRLENLPDNRRKAMLEGDWDIFEGQYFTEWNRDIHVIKPFCIPSQWKRYFTMDYGLDMLAGYFIAIDTHGKAYVYKEIYQSGLIMSDAVELIKQYTNEEIYSYFAPPDLWNRRQDSGESVADIFAKNGIYLYKAQNNRVQGWYNLKEWLKPTIDETGGITSNLKIFESCTNLIRTLPALQYDSKNPNDCADEPHEITHAPDALRYFIAGRPTATALDTGSAIAVSRAKQVSSFLNYHG